MCIKCERPTADCSNLVRHRVITAFFFPTAFPFLFFSILPFLALITFSVDPSQHPKPFGISDGLEESLSQFFLGGVFRKQQCIKAGVGGR